MLRITLGLFCAVALMGCATVPSSGEVTSAAEWGSRPEFAKASYAAAMDYLSKGRQLDAEWLVADAMREAPDSQRLHFLSGVLWRSRFEVKLARGDFVAVYKLDKDTDLAALSRAVISMDQGLAVESGFEKLAAAREGEPLVRWLYAMEARHHGLHAAEAAREFKTILKEWDVGPVMAHQTYAKLLTTDLGKPKQALEHRLLAVELEPEPWTYQGLANTYKALGRYDDADLVYGKLLEAKPYNAIYWIQWGTCRFYMEEYEDAARFFQKATVLNPKDVSPMIFEGRCLQKMDKPEEGYAKFTEALARAPEHPQAKAYAAHAKLFGYGTEPDFESALWTCQTRGLSAIDQLRQIVAFANTSENPMAPAKSVGMIARLTAMTVEGDADAAYNLGMLHRYGIGIKPESEELAMKFLTLAAGLGHEVAQREINPPE